MFRIWRSICVSREELICINNNNSTANLFNNTWNFGFKNMNPIKYHSNEVSPSSISEDDDEINRINSITGTYMFFCIVVEFVSFKLQISSYWQNYFAPSRHRPIESRHIDKKRFRMYFFVIKSKSFFKTLHLETLQKRKFLNQIGQDQLH